MHVEHYILCEQLSIFIPTAKSSLWICLIASKLLWPILWCHFVKQFIFVHAGKTSDAVYNLLLFGKIFISFTIRLFLKNICLSSWVCVCKKNFVASAVHELMRRISWNFTFKFILTRICLYQLLVKILNRWHCNHIFPEFLKINFLGFYLT